MMERTQIYLTREEREALRAIAERRGQTQSEIIREAIDNYIVEFDLDVKQAILDETFGAWADHSDVPDIQALRTEWDEREVQI
jgi:predicted transcriptional regulator